LNDRSYSTQTIRRILSWLFNTPIQ
jgi:hypothetical protein